MPPMEHFQKKKNDPTVWDSQRSGSDPDVGFPKQAETISQHRSQAKVYPGNRKGKIKLEQRMLFE